MYIAAGNFPTEVLNSQWRGAYTHTHKHIYIYIYMYVCVCVLEIHGTFSNINVLSFSLLYGPIFEKKILD